MAGTRTEGNMSGIKFRWDGGQVRRNIRELDRRSKAYVDLVVRRNGARGTGVMKSDAPWTDRTGAARAGLHTEVETSDTKYTIVFAHSVSYGIWLEVANSGNYQVIMPSVHKVGQQVMSDLDRLFGKVS